MVGVRGWEVTEPFRRQELGRATTIPLAMDDLLVGHSQRHRMLGVTVLEIHRPVGGRELVRVAGRRCPRRTDQLTHLARG
jgi:hypothetical protein